MKKVLAIILTMLIVSITVLPVCAAEAVKGTEANPYTFKEIPSTWIKTVKKDNIVIGYTITVANNKKATFKLSGTQFKEYSKGKDGKAVALTNGKLRTVKDVSVIRVVLRDKAEKKPASDVPEVNVTTHYQSGMTRDEVHASLNALVVHGYAIGSNGNLVQSDKTTPTNINVNTTSSGYQIYITGWRRSKTDTGGTTMDTLENTQKIFAFFFGNSGSSLFSFVDDWFCASDASSVNPDDYGLVNTSLSDTTGYFTHGNRKISYQFSSGALAFYVG